MSGNNKNKTGYSASDLRKYRAGQLSAPEMHELEKAALEDPFLADALEGMELGHTLSEPAAFESDLEDLQARLEKRVAEPTRKRSFFIYPWTRVAAAILLFAGLGSVAYFTLSSRSAQKESVASTVRSSKDQNTPGSKVQTPPESKKQAPSQSKTQPSPEKEQIPRQSNDSSGLATIFRNRSAEKASLAEKMKRARTAPSSNPTPSSNPLSQTDPIVAKAEVDKVDTRQYLPATTVAPRANPASEATKMTMIRKDTVTYNSAVASFPVSAHHLAKDAFGAATPASAGLGSSNLKQPTGSVAIAGKVLDEHNRPLLGASVFINGHTDISTVTDANGYFNLKLRPTDSAQKLMVAYIGYEQSSIALNNLDQASSAGNIIRLQPQHSSLDEVVVIGYGTQRKETFSSTLIDSDEKIDSLWIRATPVTGRLLYQNYLTAARKSLSVDSTIKGDEIITFKVDKKGELSSFRVEQSLSPAHDSSIIRLVREGPSWKLLRGRQARAAVRVTF